MTRTPPKLWSPPEILDLIRRKRAGETNAAIAKAMGRNVPGVKTRWRMVRAEMAARGIKPAKVKPPGRPPRARALPPCGMEQRGASA